MSRTAEAPLPARCGALVLACFVGAVALNAHHTAPWTLPLAIGASAWRLRSGLEHTGQGTRLWIRMVLVLLTTLGVLAAFRTLNGTEAGASLLVAMASLKLTEIRRLRDWWIVLAASTFLILAACLDAQSLWRMPLYALELWLLATALYALGIGAEREVSTRHLWRRAATGLLASVPLTLVLFVFFPRLGGSLWALPQDREAVTGLGDEMSPGSITRLTQSDEPALRVRFDGDPPPLPQRYWRGPVLHDFDGFTWRRHQSEPARAAREHHVGPTYGYEVTLEPNQHNVLIALDAPMAAPDEVAGAYFSNDGQLLNPSSTNHAIIYRLESSVHNQYLEPLAPAARALDLALPPARNPRAAALAQQLRAQAGDPTAFVRATLRLFQNGGYRYTLTPPALGPDSVDDLLFSTREGFCGHFASAFVTLMRAGGVPARVVTGYLGGEWNDFGSYLLVRQADAHAWAEVWLDGTGWTRVDPTAVLAPARLTHEIDSVLPEARSTTRVLRTARWLAPIVQAWQASNAWWQDEFVGFDSDKQLDLVDKMGLRKHRLRALGWLLALGGTIWTLAIAWSSRPRRQGGREDAITRAWREVERRLRRRAPQRVPSEGQIAYAERVAHADPTLADPLRQLASEYARLRYGPAPSARDIEQFRRRVRQWRPPPRAVQPAGGSRTRRSSQAPAAKNTSSTSIDSR